MLTDRLRAAADTLTSRQRRIANYVTAHTDDTAFMSITKLAAKTGSSQATIVRFCRALGYGGYSDFVHELQQTVQAKLSASARFRLSQQGEQSEGKASGNRLRGLLAAEVDNLNRLADAIDPVSFARVVDLLTRSTNVVVIGCHGSAPLAHALGISLCRIRRRVAIVDRHGVRASSAFGELSGRSCVVVMAFPRYPTETLELAQAARATQARIVGITNTAASPLISLTDTHLLVPVGMPSFADAYASPMALVTALCVSAGDALGQTTKENLSLFDEYASQVGLFVSP